MFFSSGLMLRKAGKRKRKMNSITKQEARSGRVSAAPLRPKDAATLVIIDDTQKEPKILMGRRHPNLAFLPGKYVFPGGRVSVADRRLRISSDLEPLTRDRLLTRMKGRPSDARARALGLAALRETFEETGYLIGARAQDGVSTRSREWQPYFAHGVVPQLDKLRFIARAITPPDRNRRFDTRFFCISSTEIVNQSKAHDNELLHQEWLTIEEAGERDIIHITREILEHLKKIFTSGKGLAQPHSVPFFFYKNGIRCKEFIASDRTT